MKRSDGKLTINEPIYKMSDSLYISKICVSKIGTKYYEYHNENMISEAKVSKNDVFMINNTIFSKDNKVKNDILGIEYFKLNIPYYNMVCAYDVTLFLLKEYRINQLVKKLIDKVEIISEYSYLSDLHLCNFWQDIQEINESIKDYCHVYKGTGNDQEVKKMYIDREKFKDFLADKVKRLADKVINSIKTEKY